MQNVPLIRMGTSAMARLPPPVPVRCDGQSGYGENAAG